MTNVKRAHHRWAWLCGTLALAPAALAADAPPVYPHQGPSWLRTLSISADTTMLGHLGGAGEPAEATQLAPFNDAVRRALVMAGMNESAAKKAMEETFSIDGETLYRLNCRACHGPAGVGQPPEVTSLLGFATALDPNGLAKTMAAADHPIPLSMATQLSEQAAVRLRERLKNGGKGMPPFRHLSDAEQSALFDYLMRLAGSSEEKGVRATETGFRLGENLVEGTCRVCHDATGPGAGHAMLMAGRIPSLAVIPEQLSLEAVVHKARRGWSGVATIMHQKSAMPVLSYLSEEEVAAAYLYLYYYPPLTERAERVR